MSRPPRKMVYTCNITVTNAAQSLSALVATAIAAGADVLPTDVDPYREALLVSQATNGANMIYRGKSSTVTATETDEKCGLPIAASGGVTETLTKLTDIYLIGSAAAVYLSVSLYK